MLGDLLDMLVSVNKTDLSQLLNQKFFLTELTLLMSVKKSLKKLSQLVVQPSKKMESSGKDVF